MEYVYKILEDEKLRVLEQIKNSTSLEQKAELIGNKNLLEYSLALLKKCEQFDIKPKSIFTKLPPQLCQTPSSDYRIIEDLETDDRQYWVEVKIEGKNYLRLNQGDVVIEK